MTDRTVQIIRLAMIMAIVGASFFAVGYLYRTGPQAKEATWDDKATRMPTAPIPVDTRGFAGATVTAIDLWNKSVGFRLFTADVGGVMVKSDDGEPCGDPWRPEEEWGHAATAYQCPDGTWEILISHPGDTHDQLCLVMHELGHILGLGHDDRGVMSKQCPELVRVNDKDVEAVRERFKPKN